MSLRNTHDSARRWGCISICLLYALAITASVWLVVALCGCTRTTYVPVESVRTEYRDRDVEHLATDTVLDTRLVMIKGDTVIDWRDRWHKQREYVHDTVRVMLTDSIPVPYPVERKLSRWEKAKIDYGGEAIIAFVVIVIASIVWLAKKF